MTGPNDGATLLDISLGVATITLNRPENRNALSVELVNSLGAHLDQALDDPAVRVVVLTNVGNTFCAGADLKAAQASGGASAAAGAGGRSFLEIFDQILDSPKPIIGRLAGHALAGGLGLAASCDISVASDQATFGFTEVRIGVAPAVISVVCLPKLRRADALELFLTGERVSAARAAEVGLITRAVAHDDLDAAVADVVGKVVRGGPQALAASKQLIARIPEMSRAEGFAWTGPLSASLFMSEEGQEGIGAFREKRDAAWVPRG
jgi:methylglutaconyl-CoA hydratase